MRTIRTVLVFLFAGIASFAFAQEDRVVLFETFTNSYDLCPSGNTLDGQFKGTMGSPLGAKVVFLNHHITNVGDPMVSPESLKEHARLTGSNQPPYTIFMGAVDHTVFTSTGKRHTSGIQGGTGSPRQEWDPRITERAAVTPQVKIRLLNATLDKLGQADFWRLVANVEVTSLEAINGPLNMYFAVTEDGVFFPQCPDEKPPGPTNHDNVVRYITTVGKPVDLNGKPVGTSVVITYQQDISKSSSFGYTLANMKLSGFVEKGSGNNFEVIQAAKLKSNLDTLKAPPKSLALNEVPLNGISYNPDDLIVIGIDKTSIDSVKIEYSIDNGATYTHIANANKSPVFWNAPSTTTTLGKIRISELVTGSPVVVQTGNFIIRTKDYDVEVIHPNGNDTAYINKPFVIEWSKIGVETVDIEYSANGGKNWGIVTKNKTGTTHSWFVPTPQTEQAYIRVSAVLPTLETIRASSDPFHVLVSQSQGSVRRESPTTDFTANIYPQPARKGSSINVDLTLSKEAKITVAVRDILGREVSTLPSTQYTSGKAKLEVPLNGIPAGSYLLDISSSGGGHLVQQIEIY
ncbi:MAG TPA: T9SS type A sorting domain-containing protein [Candidatus Kapabacteria bacterium]